MWERMNENPFNLTGRKRSIDVREVKRKRKTRMQTFIIRLHTIRAKWDVYGQLQWKPVGGKTWYEMNSLGIMPTEMRDAFNHTWSADMEEYGCAIKIRGWWDRVNKCMYVEEYLGLVG